MSTGSSSNITGTSSFFGHGEEEERTTPASRQQKLFPRAEFALVLLLSGLFAAYILIKPGPSHEITLIDNLIQTFLEGVGFMLALPIGLPKGERRKETAHQLHRMGRSTYQHWVAFLLSLGILSYIFGQATWTYNENIIHKMLLFPSWADAGYLGSYPFVLLAVLFLPRQRLTPLERGRIFLDGLMILIGVSTVSWYFVLGPTLLQASDSLAGRIIGTAYPVATLLVIGCLLVLVTRYADERIQPTILLFSLALVTIIITDGVYNYQVLYNLYNTGSLLDVGWPLGYMLIGLSARSMRKYQASTMLSTPPAVVPHQVEVARAITVPSLVWRNLLFFLVIIVSVLLLMWAEFIEDIPLLTPGVAVGVALLLGLLVVRQLLVYQEMIKQNHELQKTHKELIGKNEDLQRASKQLEEQAWIEGAYEQERRINQLKDQLLLNVSHELRTPLTQVSGYLELLETFHDTLTTMERMAFIEQARQGCESLLQLINSMLNAITVDSHLPEPRIQRLSLSMIVREVLRQFGPQLEHPVFLEIANEPVVLADPQFLRQVLRNLLSNAFKYTASQAVVKITAMQYQSFEQSDRQICLCVQDAGPGIAPEDIPLLFGKFVRLKRDMAGSIRGTGLGLYISKQLVEKMGGRIWVESSGVAGQGSCFYVSLPSPVGD